MTEQNPIKINCIIIDDEPLQRAVLKDYITKTPFLHFLEAFSNPLEAIAYIQTKKVDLVFLDIQMPELNGFQVMDIIDPAIDIIITSAYPDFALAGFDYNVEDYLLKPISFDRFYKAVTKLISVKDQQTITEKYIFVKSGFKLIKINLDDVLYIEGLKDYIRIVTPSAKTLSLQGIGTIELRLHKKQFVRIHKSYIIAIEKITQIEKSSVWLGDIELPIGITYRETFLNTIHSPNS